MAKQRAAAGTAYSYVRFSRPEQATGDSVRRQTTLTKEWCKRNGVRLDETLTFRDLGVSAFTGEHRSNPDRHALAAFLEMVRSGRVAKGSFLVIENLDRLSREHVRAAVQLFLGLLDLQINIVTTAPERMFRHDATDMTDIIVAVVELSRGHSESARRSERCGRAWTEKKRKAAAEKVPITRVVPAWIEIHDGAFRLIPEKAATVRRIYTLARGGHGIDAIVKTFNADGTPPISVGKRRGRHWTTSYVATILKSRAAVGEYHPHKGKPVRGNPKARQPDGPPVPGYFPAVVSEEEWLATRAAVSARRGAVGRPARSVNLFKNLLFDARTRTPLHVMHRPVKKGPPVLYPYAFTLGLSKFVSFPLPAFEAAVLSLLREVDPRVVLPDDRSGDEVLALAGKLATVEARIERLKGTLLEGEAIEAAVDALRTLEAGRRTIADQLAAAQQRAASPLTEAWGEARSLIGVLGAAPDPADARTRLRAALRRVVSEVWVLVVPRGLVRLAAVQVWFEGGRHRDYLILSRPTHYYRDGVRPGGWWARSLADATPGGFDLRKQAHAKKLETVLAGLDLAAAPAP